MNLTQPLFDYLQLHEKKTYIYKIYLHVICSQCTPLYHQYNNIYGTNYEKKTLKINRYILNNIFVII